MAKNEGVGLNHHALVIFYPFEAAKLRKGKIYIIAAKDVGLKKVCAAKWSGEHFIDFNGLRVVNVESWGNFPTHPGDIKNKRW